MNERLICWNCKDQVPIWKAMNASKKGVRCPHCKKKSQATERVKRMHWFAGLPIGLAVSIVPLFMSRFGFGDHIALIIISFTILTVVSIFTYSIEKPDFEEG